MQRRVILCAGHGGGDPGATGQGTTEAAQTVEIVNRTVDKLRADGQVEVVVVPHELGLVDSINWVNARYKNLEDGYCLEVHKNCCNAAGVETWYYGGDQQSANYAQAIQNGLVSTGSANRGIKPDTSNRHGSLGWIRETIPWAGLAEVGFISGEHLDNEKWSQGVFLGVLNLWGLPPRPNPTPVPQPEPVKIAFRVFSNDNKQIGAYNKEENAWNKYQSVNGAARIVDKDGKDVTAYFVEKYRPAQPPTESPRPEPVVRDDELRNWLAEFFSGLGVLISNIVNKLK